ncbi:N-acetyltransferase [Flavobacterium pectinovorum]|uniref:N-acetyltransferase n=1 Tax=Flavobacterium pectinovorum TaxID=29533 RepID=A0A502EI36_9FLAO|nr:N-acetyltransferase [Flavobacterium pectinovorum]TPG36150.1 N-acetyltransferase [Flavobacterium pectinovorum]
MQKITQVKDNSEFEIIIELLTKDDYKKITKSNYYFNWKTEQENDVYKLRIIDSEEILGLMSLINFPHEQRLQISLLTVSKENRGKNKKYDHIAGNLIAYACREAIKLDGQDGCVSLHPKTKLKKHYMKKYGMADGGLQIFLEGLDLFILLKKYNI